MAWTMAYNLEWGDGAVAKRFHGAVTSDDLVISESEIQADIRFDKLRYVISDFTKVTGLNVEIEDVHDMALFIMAGSRVRSAIKSAIISTDPKVRALGAEYASAPLNKRSTQVFATEDEARNWAEA